MSTSLNTMDIKQARDTIIKSLIEKRFLIDHEITAEENKKEEYKNSLNRAKEDGDTSENSAYETAIDNIAISEGRIMNLLLQRDQLNAIREPEFVIQTHSQNYSEFKSLISSMKDESGFAALILEALDNDIENADTISKAKLSELKRTLDILTTTDAYNETEVAIYESFINDFYDLKPRPYISCGKPLMYSAIRANVNGDVYTFMICPEDISYVTDGIIAANSLLGASILREMKVGEKVKIHDSIEYTITEVY